MIKAASNNIAAAVAAVTGIATLALIRLQSFRENSLRMAQLNESIKLIRSHREKLGLLLNCSVLPPALKDYLFKASDAAGDKIGARLFIITTLFRKQAGISHDDELFREIRHLHGKYPDVAETYLACLYEGLSAAFLRWPELSNSTAFDKDTHFEPFRHYAEDYIATPTQDEQLSSAAPNLQMVRYRGNYPQIGTASRLA